MFNLLIKAKITLKFESNEKELSCTDHFTPFYHTCIYSSVRSKFNYILTHAQFPRKQLLLTSADSFHGSDCYRPLLTPQVLLKYPIRVPQCSYIDKQTHLKFLSQIPPHKLINLRVAQIRRSARNRSRIDGRTGSVTCGAAYR